jgi:hypothetical protein
MSTWPEGAPLQSFVTVLEHLVHTQGSVSDNLSHK